MTLPCTLGPQPPPYQFPCDLAARARDQADAPVDALVRCRQAHADARSGVEAGAMVGGAAGRFRGRFDGLLDALDRQVAAIPEGRSADGLADVLASDAAATVRAGAAC